MTKEERKFGIRLRSRIESNAKKLNTEQKMEIWYLMENMLKTNEQ